jgi:hypothetical protein
MSSGQVDGAHLNSEAENRKLMEDSVLQWCHPSFSLFRSSGRLKGHGRGCGRVRPAADRSGWRRHWLELKRPGGRLSPEQTAFLAAMRDLGCKAEAAVGINAALEILQG